MRYAFFLILAFIAILFVLGYRHFTYLPDTSVFPKQWEAEYICPSPPSWANELRLSISHFGGESDHWNWIIERDNGARVYLVTSLQKGTNTWTIKQGLKPITTVTHPNNNIFAFDDLFNDIDFFGGAYNHYSFERLDNGNVIMKLKGGTGDTANEETHLFVKK